VRAAARRVAALALLAATAGAQADAVRARQNYMLHCMGCHGEAGVGLEGKVPSMRGTLARLTRTPQGRYYVLRVPGVTQSTLSDLDLAEVLNWSLREFSDAAVKTDVPSFTADEIARARREPLLDVAASRASALADGSH
jgi:mono/diheme cytochrome c family protein